MTPAAAHRAGDVLWVAASKHVFNDVPARAPGTLAVRADRRRRPGPRLPGQLARAGRTHPVPLIIGTNQHEAALFRWMRSPLMPITPQAHHGHVHRDRRRAARRADPEPGGDRRRLPRPRQETGMGVARDVGFRMPSIWFAEGAQRRSRRCTCTASTGPPRCCGRCAWAPRTPPSCPTSWGNLVAGPKDPTFKLGGLATGTAVSRRMRARWTSFAAGAEPGAGPGDLVWRLYRPDDRATLLIGADDEVADDPDHVQRADLGRRRVELPMTASGVRRPSAALN